MFVPYIIFAIALTAGFDATLSAVEGKSRSGLSTHGGTTNYPYNCRCILEGERQDHLDLALQSLCSLLENHITVLSSLRTNFHSIDALLGGPELRRHAVVRSKIFGMSQ